MSYRCPYPTRRCAGCGWRAEPVELTPGPSGDPHCHDCHTTYRNTK